MYYTEFMVRLLDLNDNFESYLDLQHRLERQPV